MSGYCATGIARNARAPAIVVTMAMTIARRGRSTKMADNMAQLLPGAGGSGVCANRHTRAQALESFDDHQLAAGQTLVDDDACAAFACRLDPADRGLAVVWR